jgi:hypothetical protein
LLLFCHISNKEKQSNLVMQTYLGLVK